MAEIFGANSFDIWPNLAALLSAYLLAVPIGWNREKEDRSAGLRTFPLVAGSSRRSNRSWAGRRNRSLASSKG